MAGATLPHLDTLPRRVFGIETEYGIHAAASADGRAILDAETVGREIFRPLIQSTRATSAFLTNGGRLYLDTGAHPEYATAECATLTDLLAQDRAGAEILVQWAADASQVLCAKSGIAVQVHLFKNNLDSAGNSCGCHENYLLYRHSNYRAVVDALLSFLVSRQIIVGAGARLDIKGETRFCLSQRAFQIEETVSRATTEARPLVNTRDEPLADAQLYRRLHVIVGDSNVLETPTWFKVGAMNLLLAALEAGADFSDLELDSPVAALRDFTADLSGKAARARLRDGRVLSSLELQTEFLQRLQEVFSGAQLDSDSLQVLSTWQHYLDCLAKQDWSSLVGVLDWPTKLALLEKLRNRHEGILGWGDVRLARIDLAYHDLSAAGLHLDQRGHGIRLTTPAQVTQARTQPPANTRAALRAHFLKVAARKQLKTQVDWSHLRLPQADIPSVTLEDPFGEARGGIDTMLAAMEEM